MAITKDPSARSSQPIAIIGMTCRFPGGATNPSKLWDLCISGRDAWSAVPSDRFDGKSFYDPDPEKIGRHHVRGGYFIEQDVAQFDAGFFNLPADVANALDPQIRQLLEVVYEATEDGKFAETLAQTGIPLHTLSGSNTSVFTGNWAMDYQQVQTRDPELLTGPFVTSNTATFFAGRISHFFDLRGQSMSLDTACSSGLVALHEGCQSILSGQSTMSIVGASSLMLGQDLFVAMSSLGLLGPDGRCYAWDTRAQGYGRGEGVAALVLKPLDAALRDGDRVHAVVRDTGVNQDGKTTTITSPSMEAQIELIQACYRRAGLDPAVTGYVEAHMTGTQVGDAIEAEALARTFGKAQEKCEETMLVGSVKTNIGHTEPVSGLAAIIKAAMAMKYQQVAPNQNYKIPNPKIKLLDWSLKVPTSLTKWPQSRALRASINNFGVGGTNAHVILDGPPPPVQAASAFKSTDGYLPEAEGLQASVSRVYVVSAGDSTACQEMARRLGAQLRDSADHEQGHVAAVDLADLAYTLAERRSRLPWATAVRARTMLELVEHLEAPKLNPTYSKKHPRLGFVFNGQGAQWHAMGRELIAAYPVFQQSIRRAQQALGAYGATWDLLAELLRDESSTRVAEINLAQPMSVALQLCLVDLLRSWGVRPVALTSHSSGEIAAAYAIGALTFEQALGVVYFRGELAQKYHQNAPVSLAGGMLAVGLGADEAEKYIATTSQQQQQQQQQQLDQGHAVVACINSPESVTLSGDASAIDELCARLEQDGIFAKKLRVPLAYHSHHMVPMAGEYIDTLRSILPAKVKWDNSVVYASPVTGTVVSSDILSPEHWARNLTSPVRFSQSFDAMCASSANVDMIVEIGAHGTLAGPIRQILQGRKMLYTSCLKRSVDAVETMQDLACDLISAGYPVDLNAVNPALGDGQFPKLVPDLPSYPWNHSKRYWLEPRTNKDTRYKKFPSHELLGLPVSGDPGAIPTWRNFLRVSNLPWLADHQVDSQVVLPGAAYVTLAVEAVRLVAGSTRESLSSPRVRGFRLRDIDIMNALTIPETSEGVEIRTSLGPCNESELDNRGWYEFGVSSVDVAGTATIHCRGYIAPQFDNIDTQSELFYEMKSPHADSFLDASRETRNVDIPSFYASLQKTSIFHGPSFQNLVACRAQGSKALCSICLPQVASETADYVIHPTTLDTIVQAMFGGVPTTLSQKYMLLPRSIGSMYIPSDLNNDVGSQLQVFTELVKANTRGFTSTAVITGVQASIVPSSTMRIDDFAFSAIPIDSVDGMVDGKDLASICFRNRWEPDVLHAVPPSLKESMRITLNGDDAELERKLLRSSFDLIHQAVVDLRHEPRGGWSWHHQALYQWMEYIVDQALSGALRPGSKAWAKASVGIKQRRIDELEATGACGKLTVRVGRKLSAILRGEVTPLEVMMEDNLLSQYYMELPRLKSRTYKHLAEFVELYAVKNPGAKVIEVGGGTGGATQVVLEGFGAQGHGSGSGSVLGHYTFTDVSGGFFPAAREKLGPWTSMMDFSELDIESDPASWPASIAAASYDLVVASLVLHATKNLKKTMKNVRRLLKPGGKLMMIEATQDQLDTQLIFGTFEGWWLSEEETRKHSPNAGLEEWNATLKASGFSGIDFEIGDCEQVEFQSCSVILSTAVEEPCFSAPVTIVYVEEPPKDWLETVSRDMRELTGHKPSIEALDCLGDVQGHICLFAGEMSKSLLDSIDHKTFQSLRSLVTSCHGLLWLSCGSIIDNAHPAFSQTLGFLRTLRLEHADRLFVHLDFEHSDRPWSEDKIPFISRVFRESFDTKRASDHVDWEYAVKDSQLHVPRVYPSGEESGDRNDADAGDEPTYEVQPFSQPFRTLVWDPPQTGTLSNLVFTDSADIVSQQVPRGMVRIEAKAFGLNFRDVMIALGQLDDTLKGHDVSGVVTALGEGTEQSGLQVGDRVCGIGQGRFANTCDAYWTGVAKLPAELSYTDGAAIPVVYITAYHCLVRLGALQKGNTVLIHAAAGGVGEAAIVIAQHVGARVYATCSTEAKKKLLVDVYGLDPSRIFSSRDESFAPAIMAATLGAGVDVVLNSLSGALLKATWGCIGRFGRFIEIGKVDIDARRWLCMAPFGRCAMYSGFDGLQLNEYDGASTHAALVASVAICHGLITGPGNRRPLYPIAEYSISDLEKAMRQMQSGLHSGKLVLVPRPGDNVNVVSRPLSLADPDATYMIVGGAGGVGLSIASWLITHGAKNLLLTSRHTESNQEALQLVGSARERGCRVHLRNCDVSQEDNLKDLLLHVAEAGLPPIRGVVNGAMVLQDSVFEQMTFPQWQLATKTKVASSINLHNHLPHDLDFFVLLSSVIGQLGNVSQANYGAGNTFQDALARHRGLPTVSLDLSVVTDAGFVASSGDAATGTNQVKTRVEALGTVSLAMDAILRVLEREVLTRRRRRLNNARTIGGDDDAHVILGIAPWDSLPADSVVRRDRRFGMLRLTRARNDNDDGARRAGAAAAAVASSSPTGILLHALGMRIDTAVERTRAVAQAVAERLAAIFNISVEQVDCGAPMTANAVDSLVAVELRNWLAGSARAQVSIFEVLQSSSLFEFANLVLERSSLVVKVQ